MLNAALPDRLDDVFVASLKAAPRGSQIAVGESPTLAAAMNTGRPGQWSSDHRTEPDHYTGWNYIALRAIGLQLMRAECNAYSASKGGAKRKRITKATYNEQDDKGDPLSPDHRLMKIQRRPNPFQDGGWLRYEQTLQLNSTGTCLVWNRPNRLGKTIERYVIPTSSAEPNGPTRQFPLGYWRISSEIARWNWDNDSYGFVMGTINGLIDEYLDARQVQVVRWPHPKFKDDGQSPFAAGAKWIDTADMIDDRRWSHMKQGANPSMLVGIQADSQEMKDLAEEKLNKKYGHPNADSKIMVVASTDGKPNAVVVRNTADEMGYAEAFEQLRNAIMGLHGVTPIAAGIVDVEAYAALYAALKGFITITCQPQADMLAASDMLHLVPQFGDGLTLELLCRSVDDPAILEQQLQTDLAGTVRTRNEYRLLRGLEPIEGPQGEEFVGGKAAATGIGSSSMRGVLGSDGSELGGDMSSGPQAGVSAENTLQGGQVDAAMRVLQEVSRKQVAPEAAIELLVGLGIQRDKAESMVQQQASVQPPPDPVQVVSGQNGNGKPKPVANGKKITPYKGSDTQSRFASNGWRDYP